jgi:hypothetical protein
MGAYPDNVRYERIPILGRVAGIYPPLSPKLSFDFSVKFYYLND